MNGRGFTHDHPVAHRLICGIFLLVEFLTSGIGHTQAAGENIVPQVPPSVEVRRQGQLLYEGIARCIHCHGRTAVRRSLTEQELFSIIKFGVPGTSHIPYTHLLSDKEIQAIVHFLQDMGSKGCEE